MSDYPEVLNSGQAPAILITQSVQKDYLQLDMQTNTLPTLVHVGNMEASRLAGPNGHLIPFLKAAHAVDPDKLAIIHIVDEHDPVKHAKHLKHFRDHCIDGSEGAELVDGIAQLAATRPNTYFIKASELNDFKETNLPETLKEIIAGRDSNEIRIGVIGVWTNAKVSYLLYDLRTNLEAQNLATCSALTASNSISRHFDALEQLHDILGVDVKHSAGSFLEWLVPGAEIKDKEATKGNFIYSKDPGTPLNNNESYRIEMDTLIARCVSDNRGSVLTPLSGGFSGSQVFISKHEEGASVIKIGGREQTATERFGNERVRKILGSNIPSLTAYHESRNLAAMEMELLKGSGAVSLDTFQNIAKDYRDPATDELLKSSLRHFLSSVMGRLYFAAEISNCDLLSAYSFSDIDGSPLYVEYLKSSTEEICRANGFTCQADLLAEGESIYKGIDPIKFYTEWLPGKTVFHEVYSSLTHADLNLMNILLSYDTGQDSFNDIWAIDFANSRRMPVLTDFAKIENDLSFIILPCKSKSDFDRALQIQSARLSGNTLKLEIPENLITMPQEKRYIELVGVVREIAAVLDPRREIAMDAYRYALLRYAAHTLSFNEPDYLQRRLAIHACSQLCGSIINKQK